MGGKGKSVPIGTVLVIGGRGTLAGRNGNNRRGAEIVEGRRGREKGDEGEGFGCLSGGRANGRLGMDPTYKTYKTYRASGAARKMLAKLALGPEEKEWD